MTALVLLPAYGRTYSRAQEVKADWDGGKDFRIANGPYCSIRDMKAIRDRGIDELRFWPDSG